MGVPVPSQRRCRRVALLTGGLLLAAALLKFFPGEGGFPPQGSGVAVSVLEIPLALWLLSGIRPRRSLAAGTAVFFAFAIITLWKIAHGATDCGCFGSWSPSPKMTFLIDVAAFTALAAAIGAPRRVALSVWMIPVWAALYAGALFMEREHLSSPSIMVGDRWPPSGAVDVPADLSRGIWVVLIYDSECHRCTALARNYADAVSSRPSLGKGAGLALLDVSLSGESEKTPPSSARPMIVRGALLQRGFDGHSPIRILLDGGKILQIRKEW